MPELRYYQEEALEAMQAVEDGSISCIRMACGTGKTLIIKEYLERKRPRIAILVFPRLALIEQYQRGYTDHKVTNIVVGSIEGGFSATRDKSLIQNKILRSKSSIILTTYISIVPLAHLLQDWEIDVVIYDESHHTNTDEQDVALGRMDPAKTFYFTATPVDNHKDIIYEYSYDRALQDGYSRPFIISVYVTAQSKTPEAVYEMLGYFAKKHNLNNTICFHKYSNVPGKEDGSSVNDYIEFENHDEFLPANTNVVYLRGNTPIPERIRHLEEARGVDNYTIIHSCNTVSEGVDTQGISSICIIDEKTSAVEVTQAIGRIMRKDVNNPEAPSYLLVPFFDCEGTNGLKTKDKILGGVIDTTLKKRSHIKPSNRQPKPDGEVFPAYIPPPNESDEVDLALLERSNSVTTISGIMSFFARDAPESTRARDTFEIEDLHKRVSAFTIEAHHNPGAGLPPVQVAGKNSGAGRNAAPLAVYGTNKVPADGVTPEEFMGSMINAVIEQYQVDLEKKIKNDNSGLYQFLSFFAGVVLNKDTRYVKYPELEASLEEIFGKSWASGIYTTPPGLDERIMDIINRKRFGFPVLLPDGFNKKWRAVQDEVSGDRELVERWVNRKK